MFTGEEIEKMKEQLPKGAIATISNETGISMSSVYKFLNGGEIRGYLLEEIVTKALTLIEQSKKNKIELKEKFNSVIF